jgi:hypothetical protein
MKSAAFPSISRGNLPRSTIPTILNQLFPLAHQVISRGIFGAHFGHFILHCWGILCRRGKILKKRLHHSFTSTGQLLFHSDNFIIFPSHPQGRIECSSIIIASVQTPNERLSISILLNFELGLQIFFVSL